MRPIITALILSFCFFGCEAPTSRPSNRYGAFVINKDNAVKEYFIQHNWNYPFQMDSLQLISFGEYRDSPQVFVDSNKIQTQRRAILFTNAIKYFIGQGVDSTCGYRFSAPSMYRSASLVYYRLWVERFRNNRNPKAGCECAELDSGRVHKHFCLMQFKVLPHDSLYYEGCMD